MVREVGGSTKGAKVEGAKLTCYRLQGTDDPWYAVIVEPAVGQIGSSCETRGIRVEVRPEYVPEQSNPEAGEWVFAYHIRISNVGAGRAQLLRRHWTIVDSDGESREVIDDGVVGQQPVLGPGEMFAYSSCCPLRTPWGTMEGWYTFCGDGGEEYPVRIARFYLVS